MGWMEERWCSAPLAYFAYHSFPDLTNLRQSGVEKFLGHLILRQNHLEGIEIDNEEHVSNVTIWKALTFGDEAGDVSYRVL